MGQRSYAAGSTRWSAVESRDAKSARPMPLLLLEAHVAQVEVLRGHLGRRRARRRVVDGRRGVHARDPIEDRAVRVVADPYGVAIRLDVVVLRRVIEFLRG